VADFAQQHAFSPFDEQARSHRWNPLTAVRTSPLHRVGDLLGIGQVFFPNDGSGTSSEAFFNDQARNLFLGLGLLLLETPELPRTVGELLRQSSGKGQPLKDHLGSQITQRREKGKPLTDECVDALQRLLSNSENFPMTMKMKHETSSLIITAQRLSPTPVNHPRKHFRCYFEATYSLIPMYPKHSVPSRPRRTGSKRELLTM
jgi:type IV secretory pathway TraG/TraD family ATPase VirD4